MKTKSPLHTPRLFIEAGLDKNRTVALGAEQSHYLQHVLRMKEGDELRLFNGRDGEWRGVISKTSKRSAEIGLREQLRPPAAESDLWLCCAPIKKAHFDYMIEKATELGVTAIQPLLTARAQIREVNLERCRAIAIEAAEQSERLNIPEIRKPAAFAALIPTWPPDRTLIVCAEWGEAMPIEKALVSLRTKNIPKAAVLTGPEGGLAAEELEALRQVPNAVFVRLGPRILRADTAAIAALSCWQALCGDWA
jgi:16S rRNA (uracil1498-N3)-methyltransferase